MTALPAEGLQCALENVARAIGFVGAAYPPRELQASGPERSCNRFVLARD
jgi:hypothetical protein